MSLKYGPCNESKEEEGRGGVRVAGGRLAEQPRLLLLGRRNPRREARCLLQRRLPGLLLPGTWRQ